MPKLHKLYILLALVLLVVPLLVACGDSPTVAPAATPTAVATTAAPTVVALPTAAPTTSVPTTSAATPTMVATTPATTTGAAGLGFTPTSAPLYATSSDNVALQTFTSDTGKFSVGFPGQPQIYDQAQTLASMPTVLHNFKVRVNSNLLLFVSYIDYPDSIISAYTPDAIIDQVFQATSASAQINNINPIKLGNIPGKEAKAVQGSVTIYERIYLDGIRLYQIGMDYTGNNSFPQTSKLFFDSFKITNAGSAATTDPTTSSDTPTDDLVEVKLPQAFYDSFSKPLAGTTNLAVQFYASTSDSTTVAKAISAELLQKGYTSTRPAGDNPLIGTYKQTGQSDILFSINDAPSDSAGVKSLWATSNINLDASQTDITDMLAQLKGAKTLVFLVTGDGLIDKPSGSTATPTETSATDESDLTKSLQPVDLDDRIASSQLTQSFTKAYPGVTNLNVAIYSSQTTATKVVSQIDAALKANGYSFETPNETAPAAQDSVYLGLYSKAGQPDVLLATLDVPTDDAARVTALTQLGMDDTTAQSYAKLFKGKASVSFFITGGDLIKTILKK